MRDEANKTWIINDHGHKMRVYGSAATEIERLRSILANVHDELHDPMSQFWCDKPAKDRQLLEDLRDRIDEAMGWTDD